MPPVHLNAPKTFLARQLYKQVLCIFLAFGLMVVASYLLGVSVERKHLEEETEFMAEYIGFQIDAEIRSLDTANTAMPETELGTILIDRFSSSKKYKYNNSWMLLNEQLVIIAHFDKELIGIPLREAPGGRTGLAGLTNDFEQGRIISGRKVINRSGESKFISFRQLENGWYLGASTLTDHYYRNLHNMQLVLIILGLIMASGLSIILMRITRGRDRAEERTNIMLNASPYGINFLDRQYRILDCNQAALNIFGVTDRDEYKSNFHTYSPEYQPNGVTSDEWRVTALEKMYNENGGSFEWTHQKPNGELLPLEVTFVCSVYKGQGIYIAYMRDLRQEKKIMQEKEKVIAEKEALVNMANILNGIDIMIYVTEPGTGKILFMNDSMREHYSIKGDCVGKLCYKLLQKDLDDRCDFCPCHRLDKDPNQTIVWEEHSTLTGRIYRNTDRYLLWPNGQKVHMQHSVDTTELVAAKEAAEQSSRYKSAFLANMSHEIRTPMNAILGIAEIQLRNANITPEAEDAFRKIYESGDLLINIINDILDLSKIEAGKLELASAKYDIPSLINDTAQLNRLRYESKPILFNVSVDKDMPLELFGDELRIKQILNNVLSNAFKYTDEGSIEFSVSSEADPDYGETDENVTIIFRVCDTGHGLTAEQIGHLFDEYTRFNASANRTTIGAGLGMSITSRLVKLMDGIISVESEPNKGSVFIIRIPQKRAGSARCGEELAEKLHTFRFQSMSIVKKTQFLCEYMPYGSVLVVDDVESNVYVAKGMMTPYGIKIETASSGLMAIEKIKKGKVYDIVFMDHMMPKMDGIETTKIIRSMGYTHSIVALTANALIGRAEMFLQNGFDGFISKPIDSRELNLILNEYIRNRKPPEVVEAARLEQLEMERKATAIGGHNMEPSSELRSFFLRDAENAVSILGELLTKLNDLDDEELESYVIAVHGMKSALANIGENDLSVTAFKLERAGKERNISVMSSKTPAFIDAIRSLITSFKPAEDNCQTEISDEDLTVLREKLLKIKTACGTLDIHAANAALSDLRLKNWPSGINNALDNIAALLLHSAFDEAAEAAEKTAYA